MKGREIKWESGRYREREKIGRRDGDGEKGRMKM